VAPADEGTLQAAVDALQTAAGVGGYQLLAVLISADVPNAYPALPVRDEAHACVWLEAFVNLAAAEAELVARSRRAGWQAGAPVELARLLRASAYVSRLSPTTQSLLPSPADA